MLVEPTYIRVLHGSRSLRVVAFRSSHRDQLVRLWAMHAPEKTSSMAWRFKPVELRPEYGCEATGTIPPLDLPDYWLAVQVFSNSGQGWSRSQIKDPAPLEVPAIELAFEDDVSAANSGSGTSILLSVCYS